MNQPFETEPIKLVCVQICAAGKNYEVNIPEEDWSHFMDSIQKEASDRIIHLPKGYYCNAFFYDEEMYHYEKNRKPRWKPISTSSIILVGLPDDHKLYYYKPYPKSGYGIRHSDIDQLSYTHVTSKIKKEKQDEPQNDTR